LDWLKLEASRDDSQYADRIKPYGSTWNRSFDW